jgi:hypothetical protein
MLRPLFVASALLLAAPALSGCLAFTVADAAASAAVGTVKTGAKVTGAVVGGASDAVTTTDTERCLRDAKREGFDRRLCYEGKR